MRDRWIRLAVLLTAVSLMGGCQSCGLDFDVADLNPFDCETCATPAPGRRSLARLRRRIPVLRRRSPSLSWPSSPPARVPRMPVPVRSGATCASPP